jgi:hypothetical protein
MQDAGQRHADADAANEALAEAVPTTAKTVVQIGRGDGWIGTSLKRRVPAPVVYGVDSSGSPGGTAPHGLDAYHAVDLETDLPSLQAGSVDCIVYADALARVVDPLAALRRDRTLLSPSGTIVCSVPNLQHHSVVSGLLRGVFPYVSGTLLDPSYVRFFTSASIMQLLLDAGYAPDTVGRIPDAGTDGKAEAEAGAPLFELLGVGASDAERDLRTARLLVSGVPLPAVDASHEVPISFVACVNDDAQLDANLRRSPCFGDSSPNELLVFRGCATAAEGLNAGIEQAQHEFVVFVHQDVYLPEGWPSRMVEQWRRAERQGGPIGIAGVFGVLDRRVPFDAIGRVVHRDRLLTHRSLPADVNGSWWCRGVRRCGSRASWAGTSMAPTSHCRLTSAVSGWWCSTRRATTIR